MRSYMLIPYEILYFAQIYRRYLIYYMASFRLLQCILHEWIFQRFLLVDFKSTVVGYKKACKKDDPINPAIMVVRMRRNTRHYNMLRYIINNRHLLFMISKPMDGEYGIMKSPIYFIWVIVYGTYSLWVILITHKYRIKACIKL